MSRISTVFVSSRMRSASVDFPWSMWAMIEKLRMWSWSAMGRYRVERTRSPPRERAQAPPRLKRPATSARIWRASGIPIASTAAT